MADDRTSDVEIDALRQEIASLTARCLAAEQATQAKSHFLATMSHELRTPLSGIVVAAELLDDDTLPPHQRRLARTIRASSEALQAVISDILDFSKIEAGHLTLDLGSLSLTQTVEDVAELLAVRAADKGLALATWIDPAAPDHLCGDAGRLKQVLLNLAGNAVKFTEFGHITLRARVERALNGIAEVLFEVEDTGVGIPADRLDSIFEPFVQAGQSLAHRAGGTGLGLAIARAIIEAMNGAISVHSDDSGTRFFVRVPLEMREERRQTPDLGGLRLMLACCADPGETDCLCDYLRAAGAEVHYFGIEEPAEGDIIIIDAESPVVAELVEQGLAVITISPLALSQAAASRWSVARPVKRLELLRMVAIAAGRVEAAPLPARRSCDTPAPVSGRRILLAEDHPTNRAVLRMMLEQAGHAVDAAADGEEAWEFLREGSYDLLLTDCQMPRLDGFGLARRVRAAEAETNLHLPIIALTADARTESVIACREAGMDQWLSKPASRANLQHAIDVAFGGLAPPSESHPDEAAMERKVEQEGELCALAVLDESVLLNDVLGGDRSLLVPLLQDFLAATQEDIDRFTAAWQAGDHDGARRAAHAAKGAARQAGAARLAAACQDFETTLRTGNMADAAVLAEAVGDSFADVIRAVDALSQSTETEP